MKNSTKISNRLLRTGFVLAVFSVATAWVFHIRSGSIWSDFYNDHWLLRKAAFYSPSVATVLALISFILNWNKGWRFVLAFFAILASGASFLVSALLLNSIHHCTGPEPMAVSSLQTLHYVTHEFAKVHPKQGFPSTLKELATDQDEPWKIHPPLSDGSRFYYRFTYLPRSTHGDGKLDAYQIFADPDPAHNHGYIPRYHFFMDESGTLRMSHNGPATAQSAPL